MICIGYDLDFFNKKLKSKIYLDENKWKHLSLTGASGTGKSYALIYLIANYIKTLQDLELIFCDFKNEYTLFEHSKNYYNDDYYFNGLESLYLRFKDRKSKKDTSTNMIIGIFEEWPSYLIYLSNTNKDLYKKSLAYIQELLMQGRSFSCCIWIVAQRLDSQFFPTGVRESIHTIIALGKLSPESKKMIGLSTEIDSNIYELGEGIVLFNDNNFYNIKFPKITNYNNVLNGIKNFLD